MGYKELLLVLGAVMLFGTVVITTNRKMVDQNNQVLQREFEQYALSLAKSWIEEAKARPYFDQNLVGGTPPIPSGFTGSGDLGPGGGEAYPNFNDVDDFNGYATTDTNQRGNFQVSISVVYVDSTNWAMPVGYKTRFKTMTVTVTEDQYLNSSIELSEVFAYTN